MKRALLLGCLCCCATAHAATPDFERLADVIKIHENSRKFPYGCEHRVQGRLAGYPEPVARQKCLTLCRRVYGRWQAAGAPGDYFQFLNHTYAADPNWWRDVEQKYFRR